MKKLILFILLQAVCIAGFSQNARWKEFGTPIPAHADLDVRWNASTNMLPASIWVYHLLPRKLSPEIISNLMTACGFTDKDKTVNGDMLVFNSPDGERHLRISWPWGVIDFQTMINYSPTNLVKNVPDEKRALKLTRKFLSNIGINPSDIEKEENSTKPRLISYDGTIMFFPDHRTITNTVYRAVRFNRAVDGIPFVGAGTGGDGEIEFGDYGKISRILITWQNLERDKSYPAFTPEMMIKSIREGRAVEGYPLPGNDDVHWPMVKSVTINEAFPCYYAGGNRFAPSDWLYPFTALDTTVDTGDRKIHVEIDCPIFDEGKR